jgi:hypothetical protein
VLRAIIASFPVYRTYIGAGEVREADAKTVMRAISRGMARNPAVSTSIFNFVRDTLLHRSAGGGTPDPAYQEEQRHFAGKFQQVTAPVMAKGVEDTAFYLHNRLISLNEVGGNSDQFGLTPDELHAALRQRRALRVPAHPIPIQGGSDPQPKSAWRPPNCGGRQPSAQPAVKWSVSDWTIAPSLSHREFRSRASQVHRFCLAPEKRSAGERAG